MSEVNFKNIILGDFESSEQEELISLINPEEEPNKKIKYPDDLSILTLKNSVLFPGVIIPITVGRKRSIRLVKKANKGDKLIGVIAQKNPADEEPGIEDIYKTGTIAKILKMLVLPDGNTTIIIQGKSRFQIDEITQEDPFMMAKVTYLPEPTMNLRKKEVKAIIESLKEAATKILKLNPDIPQEAQMALDNISSPVFLTHFLSSNLSVDVAEKQTLLELSDGLERSTRLLEDMLKEIQMLELKQEIQKKVHTDLDQQQRDYYLRQQIKVLQDELGYDGPDKEIADLRIKGEEKKWPEEVKAHFTKELDKIQRMNPSAPEYPISMNYVELMLDLPWQEYTTDNFDLKKASKVLDKEHFGLEKVKERILEYLAVLKLKNNLRGPILCFYGPPGVGKTSLGKSIAKALNRKYVKMSLGGLHDESEIRGHRKTYIGAMPGRIIQSLKKAKSANPVFILDEIDKVSSDFRGDPASALLEVLDPEQNNAFTDNYLEVEYDLSKVLFVATANSLDTIHPALRDRMEIIQINGYTEDEKVSIAKKHLIPRQRTEHGLASKDIAFTDSGIRKIIEGFTRESGVRNLERNIASVVRNIAKSVAMEEKYNKKIESKDVIKVLGAEIFDREMYENNELAGVVTGLAWTRVGGEILFIESNLSKGKGQFTLSGQLGDVMKESARTAWSVLKSLAADLKIDYRLFSQYDLHIHVPAGAVPKDGPSAGIAILTSIASVYTQQKVKKNLAMTGEITLSGKVLPVGGIKEKLLAAKRAGIKELILSERNKRDVDEIDEKYIQGLEIHFVKEVSQVLKNALLPELVKSPMKWSFEPERKDRSAELN